MQTPENTFFLYFLLCALFVIYIYPELYNLAMANKIEKGLSFKIILVGDSGTGKTCLIYKYIHGKFKQQYEVTVGVDFSSKTVIIDEQPIQLQIWDTCGQDVYKSITNSFYRGAAALFLVYSVDSRKSFDSMKEWLEDFQENGSKNAFIFLIGNKVDLKKEVQSQQAFAFMKKIKGAFFIETSAMTGDKVEQLFQKAAETMFKFFQISNDYRELVNPQRVSGVSRIDSQIKSRHTIAKSKKCC